MIAMTGRRRLRTGLLIGLVGVSIVLLMQVGNVFASLRLSLTDRFYLSQPPQDSIIIVALDDASLDVYGRSPSEWSRSLYGQLIERLNAAGARVVAFDLIFSEATADDSIFVEAMSAARQSDTRTRFVLAAASTQSVPTQSTLADYPAGLRVGNILQPIPALSSLADYVGLVDTFPDIDGVIRRQTSVFEQEDELTLSFPLAVYLSYLRIPASAQSQIVTYADDRLNVTEQRQLVVDANGFWRNNFFGPAGQVFPIYSFRDVLAGEVDLARFEDRIVLVGLVNNTGGTDRYLVPTSQAGQLMSGVEIHAHSIETLLQDTALQEQSTESIAAMIVAIGLAGGVLFVQFRWYTKLIVWGLGLVVLFVATSVILSTRQVIIDLFYVVLAFSLPVLLAFLLEISEEINRRMRSEFLLESVLKLEQQRLNPDRVWPLIAHDVAGIFPLASGAVYLLDDDGTQLAGQYSINTQPDSPAIVETIRQAWLGRTAIQTADYFALPIIWQERVYGVIGLVVSRVLPRQRRFLDDLTRRIAPGLENVYLYQEVQQQRDVEQTIFTNIPESIIVLDSDQRIVRWNTVFEHLTDDVALHAPLLDVLDLPDATREQLSANFASQGDFRQEIRLRNRTFNVTATPLQESALWVIILADITQLAELSELKTRMIRMASHDLKNPLSRITGYADLILMRDNLNDRVTKFTRYIAQAGEEMAQIINDILDLEQLRDGVVPYESIDFAKLVREIITRHEPDAERKAQTLTDRVSTNALQVQGNYRQLSQVVSNLLSNAIKYTPEDGSVSVILEDSKTATLQLAIRDTGYGISKEAQAELFTPFYRVRTKDTAHISGTGLGLSLVKSVVEKHNGRVWVESQEGEGSTFFVELPIDG